MKKVVQNSRAGVTMQASESFPPRSKFYQYCYCEESTFRLLQHLGRGWAIFVSNPEQRVLFKGHGNVIWDYHVVACIVEDGIVHVFDHSLTDADAWPLRLGDWMRRNFDFQRTKAELLPLFRIVEWSDLAKNFSSDRSHMALSSAPLPDYAAIICNPGVGSNLFSHFVSMEAGKGYGNVCRTLTEDMFIP